MFVTVTPTKIEDGDPDTGDNENGDSGTATIKFKALGDENS